MDKQIIADIAADAAELARALAGEGVGAAVLPGIVAGAMPGFVAYETEVLRRSPGSPVELRDDPGWRPAPGPRRRHPARLTGGKHVIDGTIIEAFPYQETGKMLQTSAGGREIWQTTMADVQPGEVIQVDPEDTRIYKDGQDITFIPRPVTLTGVLHPRGDE